MTRSESNVYRSLICLGVAAAPAAYMSIGCQHFIDAVTTGGGSTGGAGPGAGGAAGSIGQGGQAGMGSGAAATGSGGAATGSGGTATGSGGGGAGGGAVSGCDAGAGSGGGPVIIRQGDIDKLLLRGTVVTPDQVFEGEVLIVGDTVTCVAPSCASPEASSATEIDTKGIILPGLIDTNNHVLFNVFDGDDWKPQQVYSDNQWQQTDLRYIAVRAAKKYLNNESDPPPDAGLDPNLSVGCEMEKYGEIKGLIAGTTSTVVLAAENACYRSLARSIDQRYNGSAAENELGSDKVETSTLFPKTVKERSDVCDNIASHQTEAYLVNVAEGTDAPSLQQFADLGNTTVPGCLYAPQTAILYAVALGDQELSMMADHGMSLVWSPASNISLFGQTANISMALLKGINVTLATDWSIGGGSQSLLDALRYADQPAITDGGAPLSRKTLTQMVTINAARALHLDTMLGSLEAGKKADVMVIGGDRCAPYDALLAAKPEAVRLTIVGGKVLYGDAALLPSAPASPGCEALDVCGTSKFVCVALAAGDGGAPPSKLGQTFAEIQSALSGALQAYDDANLSPWKFAPIAPLVTCP